MPRAAEQSARVVIVGVGFGGLAAAGGLARAPVDVTVIDRHSYHLFQPLLYQVATATLSPADDRRRPCDAPSQNAHRLEAKL